MADKKTEDWAKKSRQIEAEKMKASRALNEEKSDKSNLAYLDPKTTKVKGWSGDSDVIRASAERMGNRSLLLVICGVALSAIGMAGGLVSSTYKLGMAGTIVSGIPSAVGIICILAGTLMAIVAIGCEIAFKIKRGTRLTSAFWTSIATIIAVAVSLLVRWAIINFR